MKSIAFLMERLLATSSVQTSLSTGTPPWVWGGKAAALWGTEHTQMEQFIIADINKRAEWRAAAATWDLTLSNIQRITRDVKREGLHKFRLDTENRPIFRALRTDAQGRPGKYTQGEAARAAWANADNAWVFDSDVPLSAFGSLLASCLAQGTTHTNALAAWRQAASKVMSTAVKLDKDCIAWYAAATRKFPAGTTEGDMIRSTVPTTYTPPPPVGQAVFSNIIVSGGTIHFDCTAPHATKFTYLHMPPGSPVFIVLFSNTPLTSINLQNQPVGLHRFKAIPRNSGGEGQESEVIEITVAAQQAA